MHQLLSHKEPVLLFFIRVVFFFTRLAQFILPLDLFSPPPRRLCFCQSLFVCLFVCQQDNSKSYGKIFLKFSGNVGNGKNYK